LSSHLAGLLIVSDLLLDLGGLLLFPLLLLADPPLFLRLLAVLAAATAARFPGNMKTENFS